MTVAITGGMKPRKATPRAGKFSQRQTGIGMANPSMLIKKSKNANCMCVGKKVGEKVSSVRVYFSRWEGAIIL